MSAKANSYTVGIGDLCFSKTDAVYQIVLGSCVTVLLLDRHRGCSGAIHYLVAKRELISSGSELEEDKIGEIALAKLLKKFKLEGSGPPDLCAWIIGGGSNGSSVSETVAKENVDYAVNTLSKFGIEIKSMKVGPEATRIVKFLAPQGEVWVRTEQAATKVSVGGAAESKVSDRGASTTKADVKAPATVRSDAAPIRVLVIDDSAPMRKIICKIITDTPGFEVAGEARNAEEARMLVESLRPQVLTLDIQMPGKNGVDFLRELRASKIKTPAILLSDLGMNEGSLVLDGLAAGAFDYLQKPSLSDQSTMAEQLCELLRLATLQSTRVTKVDKKQSVTLPPLTKLILIGSSTGGTEVLHEIFKALPGNLPPILIVQHMPKGFTKAFAERLNQVSKLKVVEAENYSLLERGHVYVAPGNLQMKVKMAADNSLRIQITDDEAVNLFKPSVDYLFVSVAQLAVAKYTSAFLLTGMGQDGARGLWDLRQKKAFTVTQDENSSLVYGMPKVAFDLGASCAALNPKQMIEALKGLDRSA